MSDKPDWEPVSGYGATGITSTDRLRVPGGWLYRTIVASATELAVATTFVPIPPGMARAGD